MLPISLYIHYPYCIRKCPYCDFNSYKKSSDVAIDDTYADYLLREFDRYKDKLDGRKFSSVYFGGGTPTLFPERCFCKILKKIEPYLLEGCEISTEANPGTVNALQLTNLRQMGINRISLGVQSFNDSSLKVLNRIHDGATALKAIEFIKDAGFDNFNIDLMHSLPMQTESMALDDLKKAVESGATHISFYELTIEEGTAFGDNPPELLDEDQMAQIEFSGFEFLEKSGFEHYEVSAFTKGHRCVHNLNYWLFNDYLGIGAGAHSKITLDKTIYRRANEQRVSDYFRSLDENLDNMNVVSAQDLPFEFMLNRLRVFDSINFSEFEQTTGLEFNCVKNKLQKASQKGLLEFTEKGFFLTSFGRIMLNDVLELFL